VLGSSNFIENLNLYFQVTESRYYASNNTFNSDIKIGKNLADVFQYYPELKSYPTVPVPLKAGSASFHSGHLIHGAGANMTPGRRAAMTIQM
jgi:ectoine hydroxylase-related dioxygenase (phytanoyl-CoA dioxygenase family)